MSWWTRIKINVNINVNIDIDIKIKIKIKINGETDEGVRFHVSFSTGG